MALKTDKPAEGESLNGFLRRLADLNAYAHIGEFLSSLEIPLGRPLIENLEEHATRVGTSIGDLAHIAPSANAAHPALEWRFQRATTEAICPACCEEGQPWQAIWRHSLVSACAHHRLRLQSRCPRCHEDLTPTRGGFRACECGLGFKHFVREPASAEECTIAELIAGEHRKEDEATSPFSSGTPSDIGAFFFFLATGSIEPRTAKAGKTPLPRSPEEAANFMAPVAKVLSCWPENFDLLILERMKVSSTGGNSAPELLGKWYQRLMRFRSAEYDLFRERVAIVVANEFAGRYGGSLVSPQEMHWQPAAAAAREIGIRAERIVEAVRKNQISGKKHRSGFGHIHTVIAKSTIAQIIFDRQRFLTATAAMEFLAVAKKQFALLCEAGVVQRVEAAARPPLTDGEFDRDALSALVDKISNASVIPRERRDTIAFRDINLRRTNDRGALLALLRAISDGQVAACSSSTPAALGDIEFDLASVTSYLKTERSPKSYTALEVAEITGWKHECVTHWCKIGLLRASLFPHGNAQAYQISPTALAEFQRRYLVISDLAQERASSSRHILHTLDNRGIPVIGTKPTQSSRRCCLVSYSELLLI